MLSGALSPAFGRNSRFAVKINILLRKTGSTTVAMIKRTITGSTFMSLFDFDSSHDLWRNRVLLYKKSYLTAQRVDRVHVLVHCLYGVSCIIELLAQNVFLTNCVSIGHTAFIIKMRTLIFFFIFK